MTYNRALAIVCDELLNGLLIAALVLTFMIKHDTAVVELHRLFN